MKKVRGIAIVIFLFWGIRLPCLGRAQQSAQPISNQSAEQPQAKTKEEHEAYVTFYQERDTQKKIDMGSKFLGDFPVSDFKPNVFLLMIQSAQGSHDSKVIVDLGERFLNDFPQHLSKPFVFQALMMANQDLNNYGKAVEYGEKLLGADPNNLSALYTIPYLLSERSISPNEEGRKRELSKAAEVAERGLSMAKPAQLSDDQWKQYQAALHSSLGLIHLNHKEYPEAQSEYEKATSFIKNDPVLYFRTGLSYSFDKKYDQAIDALSKSVFLKGITEVQAKTELERVYRIKNNITSSGPELQAAVQKVVDEAGARLK